VGTVIGLVGSGTGGTQSGLATIDVPRDGKLQGVAWFVNGDIDADAETMDCQVSFSSTYSNTNDSRSVISAVTLGTATVLTAVAIATAKVNFYDPLPDIPVAGGERLYLHAFATAGVTTSIRASLHFSFDLDQAQVRRR